MALYTTLDLWGLVVRRARPVISDDAFAGSEEWISKKGDVADAACCLFHVQKLAERLKTLFCTAWTLVKG